MTFNRRHRSLGALGSLLAAGALSVASLAAPASAASAPTNGVACAKGGGTVASRSLPGRPDDHEKVSRAQAKAIDRVLKSATAHRAATDLPPAIRIPVRAHIIFGTHSGDRAITVTQIRQSIDHLNEAYGGNETGTPGGAPSRYHFFLYDYDATHNDAWFHTSDDDHNSRTMKNTLHKGKANSLNIYFVQPSSASGLLGFATFPWNYHRSPRLDGLIVNIGSRPGGTISHYKEGDTATHEIGHWLGLLHVFSDVGDCQDNDFVTDTPEQLTPSFGCPAGKDTCPADGVDNIHNYMDYSWDSCMYQFTVGQVARMDTAYGFYRDGQ